MKCIIIAGTTASGKSSYALKLSEKIDGFVVNGDSKQVYDVLPVLTAQPEHLENHYLYGYFSHKNRIDVMHWLHDCVQTIKRLMATGKTPIIVGGTGFYLNALQEGFVQIPDVEYNAQLDLLDNEELRTMAITLDADLNIHQNDRYRLIRAINVMIGTGKTYSWWSAQEKQKHLLDIDFHLVYISKTKEQIAELASSRLDQMFPRAIDEVKNLGVVDKHIESIIGVGEIKMFLNNAISFDKMKELILIRTMQYAKQQRTWFRNKMSFDEIIE